MAVISTQKIDDAWTERLRAWQKELERELQEVLQFWMTRMLDEKNGGFYGRIDGLGRLHSDSDKGIILNSRILWTFAAAACHTNQPEYVALAHRAYDYLLRYFWDAEQGGVYWMLDAMGRPVNTRKQIYAQAFTIYALSEYYQVTKDNTCLEQARKLYRLLEKYSRDPERGGYFEAFGRNWRPIEDLRLSDKDANEAKTMNTHLHVLEAYANLYRVAPDAERAGPLRHLIRLFLDHFIDPATGHLHLFFDEDWRLRSQTVSFGHDIECSWLLYEAAEVLGDAGLLEEVAKVSLQMVEATVKRGVDKDGAVMNEAGPDGHFDTDRHWWPQAEAMVGFMNAFQLSGEPAWLRHALTVWQFIQTHHKDPATGEWHWGVNAKGQVNRMEDLAGPWKAPYHNGRACLELIRRIDSLLSQ